MSPEQFRNEFNYNMALKIIKKMLAEGLITQEEFLKIDNLNRVSFNPKLAPLMA